MTKDVMIRISGLHSATLEEETESVEVMTPGQFYEKNGKFYILYEELDHAEGALIKNTLKITPDRSLEMIKNGTVSSHMTFEVGQTYNTPYRTPFGEFNIGILANSMFMRMEENEILIDLNYSLAVNYEPLSDCDLKVHIVPRSRETFSIG